LTDEPKPIFDGRSMFFRKKQKERRSSERRDVQVLARIAGEKEGFRRVLDIGKAGLRMTARRNLAVGEWIVVELKFPDLDEELSVLGRVAWIEETGEFGLDTSQLDSAQASRLELLIADQEDLERE